MACTLFCVNNLTSSGFQKLGLFSPQNWVDMLLDPALETRGVVTRHWWLGGKLGLQAPSGGEAYLRRPLPSGLE